MIVVDTNVIGYLLMTSDQSALAEQALQKDSEWAAPLLWRSEFRNVLALYIRQGFLSLNDAQQLMDEALEVMENREFEPVSSHVLRLAASRNCTAYDCEFVAIAEDLAVPLITADEQLLQHFPNVAISLLHYVSDS